MAKFNDLRAGELFRLSNNGLFIYRKMSVSAVQYPIENVTPLLEIFKEQSDKITLVNTDWLKRQEIVPL